MSGTGTIAARCASLSSAIAQIIADTIGFSRRLRESRHQINAINADLLAIKLSLDIARDDFSAANLEIPTLLVEATSGLLDFCSSATQSLHKPIIRLSMSEKRNEVWKIFKKGDLESRRQDIKALRCSLDLVLDLVILFSDADEDLTSNSASGSPEDPFLASKHSLLKRIDVEREHVETLTEGRLPVLYKSFERLRACATFVLEEHSALQQPEEPDKPSLPRQNYHDDSGMEQPQSGRNSPSLPVSPTSTSNGIGAWIANVVAQEGHSPTHPPSIMNPNSSRNNSVVDRQGILQSQGTFYVESVTSMTRTQSSGRRITTIAEGGSRARVDSPHETIKASKAQQRTYYTTSTVVSSEDAFVDHGITSDQISAAIARRQRLTGLQRLTINQDLRNITRNTSVEVVEQMLWEGADPNVQDGKFGFLYIRAAFELPLDVFRLLVEYGADITKTTASKYYAVMHAAVLGNRLDNVRYLVALGMSVDMPNANDESPLQLAVKTPGAYRIAKFLLESGADVNRGAHEEETPFHAVMKASKLDSRERSMMVELLFAYGAEGDFGVETIERRGKGLSVLGLI